MSYGHTKEGGQRFLRYDVLVLVLLTIHIREKDSLKENSNGKQDQKLDFCDLVARVSPVHYLILQTMLLP